MKSILEKAEANFKRAQTRHHNEQERGASNLSCKQTLRMYRASEALRRAAWHLNECKRIARYEEQQDRYRAIANVLTDNGYRVTWKVANNE